MTEAKKPRPKAKPKPKPQASDQDLTTLSNGWSLVRHGTWEVSIGPDGLIMLPRHLLPEEVEDFISAITQAAAVGAAKQQHVKDQPELPPAPTSTLVVTGGAREVPSGAVALRAIGRGGMPKS